MNLELELLRQNWVSLEARIKATAEINQKLVDSVIRSRVLTTVDRIRQQYAGFYLVLTIELVFLVAMFIGNPFDFKYQIQFVPYGFIFAGVGVAFVNLVLMHRSINKVSPNIPVGDYVRGIVDVYQRHQRFEKWFGSILFTIALFVPFSFLPQKLDRMTMAGALLDTFIMICVSLLLFWLAVRLGAFKNRHRAKLERDLLEWEELKRTATGMGD